MLPESYDATESEPRWQSYWNKNRTYSTPTNADISYSVDTPPPTVSGDLHMGHIYQFAIQDFAVRFHRMYDDGDVLFPFGFDNNGIASERLAERERNIDRTSMGREEFEQLTREVCDKYETRIEQDVRKLATSIDWEQKYETISDDVVSTSQLSFIELYENGRQYRDSGPAIWCPECETAISQTELEDAESEGAFHDIEFDIKGTETSLTISTTRPELLPACVAVFVHPKESSSRYAGQEAVVPLFETTVPIIEDDRVDPETGSGVVMCCTFGDQLDVDWYRSHNLDLRIAIDEQGQMTDVAEQYSGLSTKEARGKIVEDLENSDYLKDKRPINHTVRVHERCGVENEYRVTTQWYIRILDKTEEYLEAGRSLEWVPEKMFTRYKNWVDGLEWDWCISRQRDAGVPMPCWYCEDCNSVITAPKHTLPVDPRTDDCPYDTCPECGHGSFRPEEDVLDTWATSSLTPLINAGWKWDEEVEDTSFEHPHRYPMNLRPQGHDIISFWLFNTIVKSLEHTGEVPFDTVMINGHVLDEDRRKMSASKGNVVSPSEAFEEYSTDAIRYWSAGASVGDDFPYDTKDLDAGERLLTKLWNASRVVEKESEEVDEQPKLEAVDKWLLERLASTVDEVTEHFQNLAFEKARRRLRTFFWHTFCDDYLELAKQRQENESLSYTLRAAHRNILKLFAPIIPHITEELWNEMYGETSLHTSDWPDPNHRDVDLEAGFAAFDTVAALRRWKTQNGYSLNQPIKSVTVYGQIQPFEPVVKELMHVAEVHVESDSEKPQTSITNVDLNHEKAGPKYGADTKEIEAAIERGNYSIEGERLHVAGYELEEEMFSVEYGFDYDGDGKVIEEDGIIVVVHPEA